MYLNISKTCHHTEILDKLKTRHFEISMNSLEKNRSEILNLCTSNLAFYVSTLYLNSLQTAKEYRQNHGMLETRGTKRVAPGHINSYN